MSSKPRKGHCTENIAVAQDVAEERTSSFEHL